MVLSSSKSSKKTLENGHFLGWGHIVKVFDKHDHFGLGYRITSRHPAARGGKKFNPIRFSSIGYQFDPYVEIVNGASSSQHAISGYASVLQNSSSTIGPLL